MELPFHIVVHSEAETENLAKNFSGFLRKGDVIILIGELGAGKTFFVKKILETFGINSGNSPTFAIVNELTNSHRFYHIDFYRLKSSRELFNIGFDDYLNDPEAIIFIEWGNLFPEVLPAKRIEVNFEVNKDQSRDISIQSHER